MSDTEDQLKRMVLTFRVSELQTLLGYVGKNKTGRKSELQSRAISLAKNSSAPVRKKIKQLFESIKAEVMSHGPRSNQGAGSFNPHGRQVASQLSLSAMGYGQAAGQGNRYSAAMVSAAAAGLIPYSSSAISLNSQQQLAASYPINPDVKLKKLPFYDILAELLKPSSLAPQGSGRYQEAAFTFSLTPQQANRIANSRDLRPGKTDYNVQIQMRFCLLETSCEQEDNFPPNIAVKINDKMCPLPSPIPTNKPGIEPKRPSRPVNISTLCRISPTVTNKIQVSWASEYGRCYVISAYLVQKLSSDDLLNRLKLKGVRIADFTRSLIKQKLNEDADCEIATTSLRCSLMCPLGKMRMLLPCRANTCDHLQCFDASLYLQMNERKPTWTCPVCDKPAVYDTLVIDGYFQDVLRMNTTSNEVTLHKDGSWTPLVPKKDRPEPQQEKRKSVVAVETLSDSDDDSPPSKKPQYDDSVVEEVPSEVENGGQKKKASDVEIITLESSSDEESESDDEPPAKRHCNPAQATTQSTNGDANGGSEASAPASVSPPAECVITPSVASSLAQLPATTSVMASGNGTADTVDVTSGAESADGANKADDSWRVGTVDPGKKLIFRKSMTCGSNGTNSNAIATATNVEGANGNTSEGETAAKPADKPSENGCDLTINGANSESSSATDSCVGVHVEVNTNDRSNQPATDKCSQPQTQETSSMQPAPVRTSSRATRFQGITWEGDLTSSSDEDSTSTSSRKGRKRSRHSVESGGSSASAGNQSVGGSVNE